MERLYLYLIYLFIKLRSRQTAGKNSSAIAAGGGAPPAGGGGGGSPNGSKQRRDFGGSHGSLDALTSGAERESFFALLRDLGAQSSSGSSNGSTHVPSRASPERDVDDNKPVGCAPSRLAELLKPNFHRGGAAAAAAAAAAVAANVHADSGGSSSSSSSIAAGSIAAGSVPCASGSPSLSMVQQHHSAMIR